MLKYEDDRIISKALDRAIFAGAAYKHTDSKIKHAISDWLSRIDGIRSCNIDIVDVDNRTLRAIVINIKKKHGGKVSYIAFRGSANLKNWVEDNAKFSKVKFKEGKGKVHKGFYRAATLLWNEIKHKIDINGHNHVMGHSLGAGIGDIFSNIMIYNKYKLNSTFLFGCPRVGNKSYVKFSKKRKSPVVVVLNDLDLIYNAPPFLLGYSSHAVSLYVKSDGSVLLYPGKLQVHVSRICQIFKSDKIDAAIEMTEDHDMKNYIIILKKLVYKI